MRAASGQISVKDCWSILHGVLCVHKPRDVSLSALKRRIINAIYEGVNRITVPVPLIQIPVVEPHPVTQSPMVIGMRTQPDYRKHPLVVGELVRKEDIRVEELYYQTPASSGLCLIGVNDGCDSLEALRDRVWIREYSVSGQLGRGTVDNKIRGKVNRQCGFEHVTYNKMAKFLEKLQAHYRRLSYELANVDLQSQEAFDLARQGMPRPKILDAPVIYSMKLTKFVRPNFKIRLSCASETDEFLQDFVHEIALSLDTVACCRQILRHRIGPFDETHSLLDKHFTLFNIVLNMRQCARLINRDCSDDRLVTSVAPVPLNELLDERLLEMIGETCDDDGDNDNEVLNDCLHVPWGRDY